MIRYNESNWNRLKQNYAKWWNCDLGRPIMPITFWGADPGRPQPACPTPAFANINDFSFTPEQIIDRFDFDLSCLEYAGEGFPVVYMHMFGAGVAAALMGCDLEARPETVWFWPKEILPIKELHFEYDPDNIWLRRIKDIYIAGTERWQGDVIMAMTDLGGVMDILASFRTTELLLTDLYDEPDEVLRCVREIQSMWFRFYDEINEILRPCARGYTHWAGIYDTAPNYMLQSDFSYMISTAMFDTFIQPELQSSAARLSNAFYHLDGPGQIPHLKSLLATQSIKGIQWIAGAGKPQYMDWNELYAEIAAANKKIQAPTAMGEGMDKLLKVIDGDKLVFFTMNYPLADKEAVRRAAYNYGLEI